MAERGASQKEEALSSDSNMSDLSSEEMYSCEEDDEPSTTTEICQVQNSGTRQTLTRVPDNGSAQVQRTECERRGETDGAWRKRRPTKPANGSPQIDSNGSRARRPDNPGSQNVYNVRGSWINPVANATGSGHRINQITLTSSGPVRIGQLGRQTVHHTGSGPHIQGNIDTLNLGNYAGNTSLGQQFQGEQPP